MNLYTTEKAAPISDIQSTLREISIVQKSVPEIAADGIFGSKTKDAVYAFQIITMHEHSGEVDNHTWIHIFEEMVKTRKLLSKPRPVQNFSGFKKPLTIGDTGSDVYLLQVMLNHMAEKYVNLRPVFVSGVYNINTKDAVTAYQKLTGIPATGETDKITWDSLALFCATLES